MKTLANLAAIAAALTCFTAQAHAQFSVQIPGGPQIKIPVPGKGQPPIQLPPIPNLMPTSTLKANTPGQVAYGNASENYNKTVAQGVMLGGLFGGILCNNLGKLNEIEKLACNAGVVVGAAAWSDAIAKRNAELISSREEALKAIDDAKKGRASVAAFLKATERRCDELEAEITDMKAKQARGEMSRDQLQINLADARKQAGALADGVTKASNDLQSQKKILDGMVVDAKASTNPGIKSTSADLDLQSRAHGTFLSTEPARTTKRVQQLQTVIS